MWFTPSDLHLEPVQIPLGYANAASRLGVTLMPNTAVTAIARDGDRVAGVDTTAGRISAPVVVDHAGAWARAVAATAGINVPIQPVRHRLMITEPVPGVETRQPICRVIDANVYARPEQGGLMLGGYETNPLPFDGAALAAEFEIANMPLDLAPLRDLAEKVNSRVRSSRTLKSGHSAVGCRR